MPEISIVVPYYNSNLYKFRKCLDSILKQTYSDFEVLVCIDGSENDYHNIMDEYSKKDSRFHFHVLQHAGVSSTRNYGIKNATGKYLSFIDSDDYVDPTFLQSLHSLLIDNKASLAICGVTDMYYPTENFVLDNKTFMSMPSKFSQLQYMNFSVNKLYITDIIKSNNILFNEKILLGEDALFLADYFSHCNVIASTSKLLYHYVYNSNSSTKSYDKNYYFYEKEVIQAQWDIFNTYPLCDTEKTAINLWLYIKFLGIFRYYYENNSKKNTMFIFNKIINDSFYKNLLANQQKNNYDKNSKQKVILFLWHRLGITGIYLSLKLMRAYKILRKFL